MSTDPRTGYDTPESLTDHRGHLVKIKWNYFRIFLAVIVIQFVMALIYLTINWSVLGYEFVLGDPGKLWASILLAPGATLFIWQFVARFKLSDIREPMLRIVLGVLFLILPLALFAGTYYEAKLSFEKPSPQTPPYPTDYWKSFSSSQLGEEAIKRYCDGVKKGELLESYINALKAYASKRPINYSREVGLAGILGHTLSAFHFALAGVIVLASIAAIFTVLNKKSLDPILFAYLSGAFLCMVIFIPLQFLSLMTIWGGAHEPLKSIAVGAPILIGLTCIILITILWLLTKHTKRAKLVAQSVPPLITILSSFRKEFADWLSLEFPQAPWMVALGVSTLVVLITMVCLVVVLRDDDLG